ncbi:hypothetical protein D3C72_2135960 [compost metagenome]
MDVVIVAVDIGTGGASTIGGIFTVIIDSVAIAIYCGASTAIGGAVVAVIVDVVAITGDDLT